MAKGNLMTFFETIQARHSIREFQDQVVEEDKLQRIVSAMSQALPQATARPTKS